MRTQKLAIVIAILSGILQGIGQEVISNIDSVKTELEQAPEDTTKVLLLQKLAGHYNVVHLDSAKAFAEQGIQLSEALNFPKGKWINLNTLGNYYERKSSYDEALSSYKEALEVIKSLNSTKGFAVVLNNIATIHIRRGSYEVALTFLFDALKAEEKLGNRNGIAQAYNNIGVVYYYLQNFDKTTQYLTQALEIQEELGNYAGLQNGYNNVGAIFDYQQKYDEAIASYNKAYDISLRLGDKKEQASNLSNIGLAYSKKKDFTTSERYFLRSIELRDSIKDYNGIANTYVNYGESLRLQKQFKRAESYLKEALRLSQKHKIKLATREAYSSLAELAKDRNDLKLANTYLYKYIAVKDSILNEENAKIIAETEAKYESEKKEKEIMKQRAQLAEKELEVKRKNMMIFGGFGLAVIFGLFGYLLFNQQKLKNRQLRKENELKTALARIETQNRLQEQRLRISRDLHDNIGAQLTFIISSIDSLRYGFKDMSEPLSQRLSGIGAFAGDTIYELRDTIWAMNKNSISFEDLQTRITNFIEKARSASQQTAFEFSIASEISAEYMFTSVEGMNIYRIIQEAVNNALKYADAAKIFVKIKTMEDDFLILIKDDGKGFNSSEVTQGNGLNNMKKRAIDLKGKLAVKSKRDLGTTVALQFPRKMNSNQN